MVVNRDNYMQVVMLVVTNNNNTEDKPVAVASIKITHQPKDLTSMAKESN